MPASLALVLAAWVGASGLATPADVATVLDRLGDADLVLVGESPRSAHVLLATRVMAPVERLRQILVDPGSYSAAIPAFRRLEVVSKRQGPTGGMDLEIAWELEVPLWNLAGRLWLRPQPEGVDVELAQGDFAPGLFHLTARPETAGRTVLALAGSANVRDANWVTRRLVKRSALAEPAIAVAATYVLLKALALYAEHRAFFRGSAAMAEPDVSLLYGVPVASAFPLVAGGKKVLATVRSRPDGRLARIEVALQTAAPVATVAMRGLREQTFRVLPGWKSITLQDHTPSECQDARARCWDVDSNLPFFSLDATWKIWPKPWRARAVAGGVKGAVMALDMLPGEDPGTSTVVLSQQPRMERAGYISRRLIASEPLLEHGLALALTYLDAVSLGTALGKD